MTSNAKRRVTILWMLCYAVPIVLAQPDAAEERKWTVRVAYRLADSWADFNSRGLVHFLEANDFDHRESSSGKFFSSDLEYPLIGTEDASWSGLVAYSIRPPLSVGGAFYQMMMWRWRDFASSPTLRRLAKLPCSRQCGQWLLWRSGM